MCRVRTAIVGLLIVASMTLSVAALPALAEDGGGDAGGVEPSGPGSSITTEAVGKAIRAADDAEEPPPPQAATTSASSATSRMEMRFTLVRASVRS